MKIGDEILDVSTCLFLGQWQGIQCKIEPYPVELSLVIFGSRVPLVVLHLLTFFKDGNKDKVVFHSLDAIYLSGVVFIKIL